MSGFKNGLLAYVQLRNCPICWEPKPGKHAGLRGTKMLVRFECLPCGWAQTDEISAATTPSPAPAPARNGSGHHPTVCPHCGHEFEA